MKLSFALAGGLSLAFLGASLAPAHALSARVLVSSAGTDATGCGLSATSPCRTFQYVINNIIAPGGEIDVLNAGGYGPIAITQSIKIVNDGAGAAGIGFVAGGASISINVAATDIVVLTGLNVDGFGSGANGIAMSSAGTLIIDKCVFRNFHKTADFSTGNGVFLNPTSGAVKLSITNSTAANDEFAGFIWVTPNGSATLNASFDHVTAINNLIGVAIDGVNGSSSLKSSISNSVVNNNTGDGIDLARGTTVIDSTQINNNAASGLKVDIGALALLRRSILIDNLTGINIASGAVDTYGDNSINSNGTDVTGALTATTLQ